MDSQQNRSNVVANQCHLASSIEGFIGCLQNNVQTWSWISMIRPPSQEGKQFIDVFVFFLFALLCDSQLPSLASLQDLG